MFNFMTPVKQMHKGLYFILTKIIWKTRNYIKYNKSTYREAIVITNLKNELKSNIQMMIKNPEVRNLYNIRKLQLLLECVLIHLRHV
jgi:hypothetical protein